MTSTIIPWFLSSFELCSYGSESKKRYSLRMLLCLEVGSIAWTPLFIGWLTFLENHRRSQYFFCKNGGIVYRKKGGGGGGGRGRHCFLSMIYGFCSSNALYSASLSFTIFIFNLFLIFHTKHKFCIILFTRALLDLLSKSCNIFSAENRKV